MTWYIIKIVGNDSSVGQGFTACTTSPCVYVHQVMHTSNTYTVFVTSINRDGILGSQNSTTIRK